MRDARASKDARRNQLQHGTVDKEPPFATVALSGFSRDLHFDVQLESPTCHTERIPGFRLQP